MTMMNERGVEDSEIMNDMYGCKKTKVKKRTRTKLGGAYLPIRVIGTNYEQYSTRSIR